MAWNLNWLKARYDFLKNHLTRTEKKESLTAVIHELKHIQSQLRSAHIITNAQTTTWTIQFSTAQEQHFSRS